MELGEICNLIVDCEHKTAPTQETGYPSIRTPNIARGFFILDNVRRVSEETYRLWTRRAIPKQGDLIMAREAPVGNVAIIPPGLNPCLGQRTLLIRCNKAKAEPAYVSYLLNGPQVQGTIYGMTNGVTVPHLNMRDVRTLPIPEIPEIPIQRKIATILSAYDDLIENNLRRIKILEEMAQALYREWFVKFRFPGYEKVRMVDSALGKIPEGWEVVPFTDIADVLSGGTPKTKIEEYWGGSIPFFTPKDAPDSFYVTNTEKSITEIGLSKCNSRLYPKDTVFITARGTVGKVVMPSMGMAMNQSCYALRGKDGINQHFLFLATKQQVDYLRKNTGGATFDTIVVDTFTRMEFVRPSAVLIDQFSRVVQPGMELILNTINKNANLRQTRDLLLPKLISGELDVSDLEINIPEEAA